jgi:hypothetical protein
MSTVEEIEHAVEELAPAEFARLATWFSARHHAVWTRQMEREAAGGKLDFLFAEAETERVAGQLHDWPDAAP